MLVLTWAIVNCYPPTPKPHPTPAPGLVPLVSGQSGCLRAGSLHLCLVGSTPTASYEEEELPPDPSEETLTIEARFQPLLPESMTKSKDGFLGVSWGGALDRRAICVHSPPGNGAVFISPSLSVCLYQLPSVHPVCQALGVQKQVRCHPCGPGAQPGGGGRRDKREPGTQVGTWDGFLGQ